MIYELKSLIAKHCLSYVFFVGVITTLSMLAGCGSSTEALAAVDYTPLPGADWEVSTPADEGLEPELVAKMYLNAAELETIYSLLTSHWLGVIVARACDTHLRSLDEPWRHEKANINLVADFIASLPAR